MAERNRFWIPAIRFESVIFARLALSEKLLEHGLRCRHRDYQSCPRFQEMVHARLDGVELAEALNHD